MIPQVADARLHVDEAQRWDVVVRPDRPWWQVDVKELWSYRDLLLLMVRRDLTAVYKQTILGPLWVILQPLLTSIMFAFVFGRMGRFAPPEIPGLLFYMSAIVPWGFFSGVITRTSQTLVTNQALMTKVYFPRLVAPMSTLLSAGFNFLVQLTAFIMLAIAYALKGDFHWNVGSAAAMLPVLVVLVMVLSFGLGIIVAALTTRYRDFSLLVGFAVQLLMFMSPVIFPLSRTDPGSVLRRVVELNPMTPLIEGFRAAFLGLPTEWSSLFYSAACAIIALVLGLIMFQRMERSFADVV
ncbi:MAG: ABC transporter permease [Flavobacteriales bacterium]|nr:ABC transporter permease [Flavobacteriales bacterium]